MINTELFKSTMEKINAKILEEKKLFVEKQIPINGESDDDSIDSIIEKTYDTSFKLLVMGRFSSGKSAFVNVLLGEKLLPEKALPTTALITEVYYGKEKKVVMYPREGKWQNGNEPFEIEPTLEKIKKYSTIDNKTGGLNRKEANRVDSCFEKMVVYWPLEMLKDGVSIIDSPGTDDPYCNDHIVETYVPKADAILYCIAGTQAYNEKDRATLDRLNVIGYNPIIVTTYFDVVTDGQTDDEKKEFMDTTFGTFYTRHTSKEYCHYVDSRLGMKSKKDKSQADYVASGYCELEKFLGKYLTESKGLEKIGTATAGVNMFNKIQTKRINAIIDNLFTPLGEFDDKVKAAEKDLERATQRGELLIREFNVAAKTEKMKLYEMIPSLFDDLYNITLDDFVPNTAFSIWHPKKCSEMLSEECAKEIEIRKKAIIEKWSTEKFTPAMMKAFENITQELDGNLNDFSADITRANISVSASGKYENNSSGFTKAALCIANWAVGGIISGVGGDVYGAGGLARNMLCQIGAVIALEIIASFTPVGLAANAIAAIVASIVGTSWNASIMPKKIKEATVKHVREALEKEKDKMIANVEANCDKIFNDAEKKFKSSIDDDINAVRNTITLVEADREKHINNVESRKAELETVKSFVAAASTEMDGIRAEFKLTPIK